MIEMPFQIEIILTLTYRCNFKCNMCTQTDDLLNVKEMNIEDYKKIFDDLSNITPLPKILLFGGEPLIYPHFDEILDLVQNYGFPCQLVTNGYYLEEHLDKLNEYNIGITISLDGTKIVHNNIRNNPYAFEKATQAMDKIKILQKNNKNIELMTNFVMLPDNMHNMLDFGDFMTKYNPDGVTIQHLQFSSPETNNQMNELWQEYFDENFGEGFVPRKNYHFDEEYVERLHQAIDKVKSKFGSKLKGFVFPFLEKNEMKKYYLDKDLDSIRPSLTCTKPWFNPTIEPNGDVSCCVGYKLGNIKEQSFEEIWLGERVEHFRNTLAELKRFPICPKCCCFYKSNFFVVDEGYFEIKGKKLVFPSELNYVQSASRIAIVLDSDNEEDLNKEEIQVLSVPIHSDMQLQKMSKELKVLAIIK